MAIARNRLPMPARANSKGVCSGVSIVCLSEKAGKEGLWSEAMASAQWVDKRRPHWERLEALCRRAGNHPAGLSHAELQELGLLYRQTASDLSVAQGDPSGGRLAPYLNQLLGRSHNLIYLGKRPKAA